MDRLILLVLVIICSVLPSEGVQYSGCSLIDVNSTSKAAKNALIGTQKQLYMRQSAGLQDRLEFWSNPETNEHTLVVACKDTRNNFLDELSNHEIQYTVNIQDMESELEMERNVLSLRNRFHPGMPTYMFTLSQYHDFKEMRAYMNALSKLKLPTLSITEIGKSVHHIPIYKAKIGIKSEDGKPKPSIFIDCGLNPLEWASPATCFWMIDQLAFSKNSENLVEAFDWHIVPVANPDGYEWTWSMDRFWQKNLQPGAIDINFCPGVNLNRNFNAGFYEAAGLMTTHLSCSPLFSGPSPFSEPETAAIRNAVLEINDTLKMYLSLHAFGEKILMPYGYKLSKNPDYDSQKRMADIAGFAMQTMDGNVYERGTIHRLMEYMTGDSVDWAYEVVGVKYAYALQLRDKGWTGFLLPSFQIEPAAKEAWTGISAMAVELAREYGIPLQKGYGYAG